MLYSPAELSCPVTSGRLYPLSRHHTKKTTYNLGSHVTTQNLVRTYYQLQMSGHPIPFSYAATPYSLIRMHNWKQDAWLNHSNAPYSPGKWQPERSELRNMVHRKVRMEEPRRGSFEHSFYSIEKRKILERRKKIVCNVKWHNLRCGITGLYCLAKS